MGKYGILGSTIDKPICEHQRDHRRFWIQLMIIDQVHQVQLSKDFLRSRMILNGLATRTDSSFANMTNFFWGPWASTCIKTPQLYDTGYLKDQNCSKRRCGFLGSDGAANHQEPRLQATCGLKGGQLGDLNAMCRSNRFIRKLGISHDIPKSW